MTDFENAVFEEYKKVLNGFDSVNLNQKKKMLLLKVSQVYEEAVILQRYLKMKGTGTPEYQFAFEKVMQDYYPPDYKPNKANGND